MSQNTVFIAGGGTGGHIYPGIAIAQSLSHQQLSVVWMGSGSALEKRLLQPYGWAYHPVYAKPFRGTTVWQKLCLPSYVLLGICLALYQCLRYRPKYVITMGGYVSVVTAIAAFLLCVPVFVCEQNAKPGLANRVLCFFASQIFTAYPGVFQGRAAKKTRRLGNPLRENLLAKSVAHRIVPQHACFRILVMGGSQGATVFNQRLPDLLGDMQDKSAVQVTHIAGAGHDLSAITALYQKHGIAAQVTAYVDDISQCYLSTDVVIARAGALTLSEIVQFQLPALLVPLPGSADNHQFYNAWYHQQCGACWMLEQSQLLTGHHLVNMLHALRCDPQLLQRMSAAAARLQTPQAGLQIVQHCQAFIQAKTVVV